MEGDRGESVAGGCVALEKRKMLANGQVTSLPFI